MATTKIEWADTVWNAVTGCTKVSTGCKNCYAERMAKRLQGMHSPNYANGFKVTCHEHMLDRPLHWAKPCRVFVNSMSDLFHPDVPDEFREAVFGVIAACQRHSFIVLTKRPETMAGFLITGDAMESREQLVAGAAERRCKTVWDARGKILHHYREGTAAASVANRRVWPGWPLPNLTLGVSCEEQPTLEERLPHILRCPAAKRALSLEPLLGGIRLPIERDRTPGRCPHGSERCGGCVGRSLPGIHQVYVGPETGPGRRPCELEWIRDIIEQCDAASVPAFVKAIPLDGRISTDMSEWPPWARRREIVKCR